METQKLSTIIDDEISVRNDLAKIGLSVDFIKKVALAAAAARAESLSVDPVSAPGLLSYIYGVREIRMGLLKEGWCVGREGNVEATVNHSLNVQLLFQNVDLACHKNRIPQAVSKKGEASRGMVAAGQTQDMFDQLSANTTEKVHGSKPTVWVICVSADENGVKAEVSCPTAFEGSQFEDFHHRIFAVDESYGPDFDLNDSNSDGFEDFDVTISRKQ